jgi:hypothetical protein
MKIAIAFKVNKIANNKIIAAAAKVLNSSCGALVQPNI